MDRLQNNKSPLDFSLTWESPLVNEIIPTLALVHVCFIFFFFFLFWAFYLWCWRLLIQLVLRVSVWLYGLKECVTLFNSSEKVGKRSLTSSKISNDVDGKPCSRWPPRKKITCWMFSVVRSCEGKVLGIDSDERPVAYYIAFYCLLYCILLSTGFTVRKLYYVSILFYYASVFDFPKYKKLYIALCYGR